MHLLVAVNMATVKSAGAGVARKLWVPFKTPDMSLAVGKFYTDIETGSLIH